MTQPTEGQVYKATDGKWYRWPNPTPYDTQQAATGIAPPMWGSVLPAAPAQRSFRLDGAGGGGSNKAGLFALGALVILVLVIVASVLGGGDKKSEGPDFELAPFACQDFVKRQLKAPSTADFNDRTDRVAVRNSDDSVTVRGHVDAENGFGAKIRSSYTCTTRFNGEGWVPVSVALDE